MPKSRHGKGKHYRYSKKSKSLRRQAAGTAPAAPASPVATASVSPAAKPVTAAAAPQPKVTKVQARTAENPYPFITSELKRIGILTGIILVILVILSLVLK